MSSTDITPEDSVVPIYLVPDSIETIEERALASEIGIAEETAKQDAKISAMAKLAAIGLTEEEIKTIIGI